MKKIIVILVVVLLLVSLSGCGIRQKAADKLAGKITEGIIEKATGDNVDIDLDGDKVTVKGSEGETAWTMGGGDWPKDGVATQIPEFKKGEIASVINAADSCWIEISNVSEADYRQYVEALKDRGFKNKVTEFADESSLIYSAYKNEDLMVTASYSFDGTFNVQVMATQE